MTNITKDFLAHEYVTLGKSSGTIAGDIGVRRYVITNALAKFKIKTRPLLEARRPAGSTGRRGYKWCPICRTDKPMLAFNKGRTPRRDDSCRACRSQKTKGNGYGKRHRNLAKARLVVERGNRCARCGIENLPLACFQFHHRDRAEKKKWIGDILASASRHPEEFAKCDLLCSHCHAIEHWGKETALEIITKTP